VPETHHIYLVPGFFGFVNFGRLVYFSHVREYLEEAFGRRGVQVELHRVRVAPTASIRQRAAELVALIAETSARGPIHVIGHSTGGLDARLFVTPGVSLPVANLANGGAAGGAVEDLARRVRTIVTVATPHHGTPLASFFTGLLGQKLLSLLSVSTLAVLRQGRLPLSLLARIGAALSRVVLPGGKLEAVLEHLEAELVGRLPPEDRDQVTGFIRDVGRDPALLPQLTPEGIDLFNAACSARPDVRYGAVVSRALRPRWTGHLRAGWTPDTQASFAIYRLLHARTAGRWRPPPLSSAQRVALVAGFGEVPLPSDSDGVVPTLSQVHGEIIATATGDHLDVIGHFGDERHQPPHHDWLTTGSRFDRAAFERLWSAVASFIVPETERRWWAPWR
jgi:triacylglycerol lipase